MYIYPQCVCVVGFVSKERQQNKECNCKHHIKNKSEFFFAKSSKFSEVQMGHLHTCPLHLKLMPIIITYLIMRKQETIHLSILTTFSTHNWTKLLQNCADYLIRIFPQPVVICHACLCIVINHSLYYCREHKLTFQIVNNWGLKY